MRKNEFNIKVLLCCGSFLLGMVFGCLAISNKTVSIHLYDDGNENKSEVKVYHMLDGINMFSGYGSQVIIHEGELE